MIVFIPGSIRSVIFGPAGTDPVQISIPTETSTSTFLEVSKLGNTITICEFKQNFMVKRNILYYLFAQ